MPQIEHRLVEIGYDVACSEGQFWQQYAATSPVLAAISKTALGDNDAARCARSAANGSKINGTI